METIFRKLDNKRNGWFETLPANNNTYLTKHWP